MMRKIMVLLGLVLASFPGEVSAEGILFERTIGVNRSVNIFDVEEFDLDLTLGDQFFTPTNPVTLFDDLLVTPDDAGNVHEVLVGDAAFDVAAQRLTDNQNEFIRLIFTENQSNGLTEQRGWSESNFFLGLASPSEPDLSGSIVERIRLSIDQFDLVSAASGAVAASSSGPPVNLQLTVTFFGRAIPEPGGMGLLISAIFSWYATRRGRWSKCAPVLVPICRRQRRQRRQRRRR